MMTRDLILLLILLFITNLLLLLVIIYSVIKTTLLLRKVSSKNKQYQTKILALDSILENKLSDRTREIKKEFERKVETIHSQALLGNITANLIHDLSASVSAVLIAFELLKNNSINDKDREEIINRGLKSAEQISRIVSDTRDLMSRKTTITNFSPSKVIETILFVLKEMIQRSNIKIDLKFKEGVNINGISVLFERIVINLLVNAIEELNKSEKVEKKIVIEDGYDVATSLYNLEISDNGDGINELELSKVFQHGYSLKDKTINLGFGLTFVKDTIEKYFNGSISIQSKVSVGTKFKLRFYSKPLKSS